MIFQDTYFIDNVLIMRELLKHSNRQLLVSNPSDQFKTWGPSLIRYVCQINTEEKVSISIGDSVKLENIIS